jgi:hypothetical protein
MKMLAAALGGILLVLDYSYSAPVGLALLLFAFRDEISALVFYLWATFVGPRMLRELRRNPHRRASGLLVVLIQDWQMGR